MQGEVSMVMPCYNKVEHIGEMFDSIIAQEWDNIELILINDGSTDGTRDVIESYKEKFLNRGFEVVIIDQENAGVCAAGKAGLMRVTGKYVCMVDSDDELDPKYVSTMAGWLEEHEDYDYCICNPIWYEGRGNNKIYKPTNHRCIDKQEPFYLERCFFQDISACVWVYLLRVEYLKKCKIIESYYTDTKGSHEPGFFIPIAANNGRFKHFPLTLYHLNIGILGHSRHEEYASKKRFWEEYFRLCKIAIERLPSSLADENRKRYLTNVAQIANKIHLYWAAHSIVDDGDRKNERDRILENFIDCASVALPYTSILPIDIVYRHYHMLNTVKNMIIRRRTETHTKRIIAYEIQEYIFGMQNTWLYIMDGAQIKPTEHWKNEPCGKRPDFTSLDSNDLLLLFTTDDGLANEIKADVKCQVMDRYDVALHLYLDYFSKTNIERPILPSIKPVVFSPTNKKTQILIVHTTLKKTGEEERSLLSYINNISLDECHIDLVLFDDLRNTPSALGLLPEDINIIPLVQFSKWTPDLMQMMIDDNKEEFAQLRNFVYVRNREWHYRNLPYVYRDEQNWNILKQICPCFECYDIAVAFTNTLPLKIVAEKVSASKKVAILPKDTDGEAKDMQPCVAPFLESIEKVIYI